MPLPFPLSLAVETAINAVLRMDPETQARLRAIDAKTVRFNIQHPTLEICLTIAEGRVNLLNDEQGPADATISGSLAALKSLTDGNDALYTGEVTIEGDLALGQQLKEIMAGVDPDWQEAVAPLIGDTLTHRLDRLQQQFSGWSSRTRRNARQNTSDYLQEEIQLLAPNSEINRFCSDVDDLRATADRLEARLQRLERQSNASSDEPDAC